MAEKKGAKSERLNQMLDSAIAYGLYCCTTYLRRPWFIKTFGARCRNDGNLQNHAPKRDEWQPDFRG